MTLIKRLFFHLSIWLFLLASITIALAQENNEEDIKHQNRAWSFGINVGAGFANKYHANFYSGEEGNQNEISYIFSNKYYRDEIYQVLNDSFEIYSMPIMRYKPTFCVGMYIKKNFTTNFGAFIQFNFSRFTSEGFLTLKLGATPPSQAYPNTKDYPIWGKEDRINIDIGASGEIPFAEKIYGFLEVGFNLNNTKVRENKIAIETLEYSIVNVYGDQPYIPNTQLQEYPVRQGGIGLGAFLSPGIKFRFNENIAIDLLGSIYWAKINLMHYNTFRLHYNVMLRFLFSSEFIKSY
ncbi:MAG: hypothetical protein PHR81_04025 [Bacteroidales bacterium]|nr:hypothetical protein [Bacteroidales bacterium]MDD4213959.1 hypothetical protein [Bacteroidales bacterium]